MTQTVNGHRNGQSPGKESKVPPRSIEQEESIIGAVLGDWDALDEIGNHLRPELFSGPELAAIFSGLLELPRLGGHPPLAQVVSAARSKTSASEERIVQLIDSCMSFAASWSNIKPCVETIVDTANRRRLLYAVTQAEADIYLGRTSTQDIAGAIVGTIDAFHESVNKVEFPTLSSRDLFEGDFSHNYLIPGLLVEKQPCILAGPKKCLKSNILTDLNLSLASGSRFLNEFYVDRPVRSAFISGESGQATTKETAIRQAKTKPWVNLADYENAFWCFTLPKLGQPNSVRSLIRYVQKHQIQVLIIDPAYLAMPLGESTSNLFLVGSMLSDLSKVTAETGVTIVLCHHTRRPPGDRQYEAPELELLAWAGFQEWARQWLLLGRRAPYDPDSDGFHELWLVSGGSAGHSGLWAVDVTEGKIQDRGGRRWDVAIKKASEVRQDEAEQRDRERDEKDQRDQRKNLEKLLVAYKRFPDGETPNKVKERAGLSGTKFNPANDRLADLGIIEKCEIVKSNKSYSGFKLTALGHSDNCLSESDCPASPDGEGLTRTAPISIYGAVRPSDPDPDGAESDSLRVEDYDVFGSE